MYSERDLPLTVFKPHVQIYAILERGSDEYTLTGHGFVSIINDQIENQTVHYLQVQRQGANNPLLRSKLRLQNNYQKQRGSVIVWQDPLHNQYADHGISFESVRQCDIFWYNRRLICEKIGKNYLEISGWDKLPLPNQNNLAYILEKTKTSKDLVQYNLLHSPNFSNSLFNVFKKFEARNDTPGRSMVGKIIKSIFHNPDYRMIEALFRDPTFDMVLYVQKYLQKIDFPTCWAQKLKIRNIIPLNQQISNKIKIVHRLSFYRQSILDLMKEANLQQMLVMTQVQFCKDIISSLTKENILDDLIKSTYQNTQDHLLLLANVNKDLAEEETLLSESEEIRCLQFAEKKMEFLLEALIISKQIQDQNAKLRLLEKIYKSGVIQMVAQYLDRGIYRAIDFFIFLVRSSPTKFIDYLKAKYKQSPSSNLYIKLCRKYNFGNQQMQNCILQLIKYLSQTFKVAQNLQFFTETFFKIILGGCKDQKAVLALLSQVQSSLSNVQTFFGLAISNKVFYKLAVFLMKQKKDKTTDLRAIKLLKRVLQENADFSLESKRVFLDKLNSQIVKSKFFSYCLQVLQNNMALNNVISSSMLANLKIISQINRFTRFHQALQKNHDPRLKNLSFFAKILDVKPEITENNQIESQVGSVFQNQQQEQNDYFLPYLKIRLASYYEQLEQPNKRMRMDIQGQEKQQQQNEGNIGSQPSKKVKQSKMDQQPSVLINVHFDELQGNK